MKNIAEGDGELGSMYRYFNETIQKIQQSISLVKSSSEEMNRIGGKLANDMNDTAALVWKASTVPLILLMT